MIYFIQASYLIIFLQTIKNYDKMIVHKLKSKITNRKCYKYF